MLTCLSVLWPQTVLEDTLEAFAAVCVHSGFRFTPIVLFLNKKDTFKNKLKVSPLSAHMPDYKGVCACVCVCVCV